MFLIKVMSRAQVLALEKDGIFSVVKPGSGFASEPVTGNISEYGGDNECNTNGEYGIMKCAGRSPNTGREQQRSAGKKERKENSRLPVNHQEDDEQSAVGNKSFRVEDGKKQIQRMYD